MRVVAFFIVTALAVMLLICFFILVRVLWDKWQKAAWIRAESCARWEEHTELDWENGCAEVMVRKVARRGKKTRVLARTSPVSVKIHGPALDLGDPELLNAKAEAMSKADSYNMLAS